MAVVKNLMIRIGADYSPAKKAMDGATRELTKFRRDTEKTTTTIKGKKGLGGISDEYKKLGGELSASISRLRGAKGIGGMAAEVKTLIPLLGRSAAAMETVGVSAAGLVARLGPVGIAVGTTVAVLGALVAISAKASQEAVKFDSTIGRLNMQLKGGSRDFMQWARAQGLAKSTAADLGATYGTLLSSFISDNKELQNQTKNIVQTTRVVADKTGRPIEDVLERMRSGLLGNTEAIEDLGIFVNVAMIESTQAFQKFANGKSWDQLDFRVQQQIRLAAILEQAYARYGNELQNNTMSKQSLLIEQLKDIKLNVSQAFLPIYDSVLPALTRLAEGVANVTEQIARFMYSLRGWDYDEMTQGTDQQTGAVENQSGAYDDLARSVKKARGELAGFDELNLIGDPTGGAGGGGGGGGGLGVPGNPGGSPGGSGGSIPMPQIPTLPRLQLQFDPPNPPDAGIGAVATAVSNTVNRMTAELKQNVAQMWKQLQDVTGANAPALQKQLAAFFSSIGQTSKNSSVQVSVDWKAMLASMLSSLVLHRPLITAEWELLKASVGSMSNPLGTVKLEWKGTLSDLQQQLNAYRPYLEYGWALLRVSVQSMKSPLSEVKAAWKSTLADMQTTAANQFSAMVDGVNSVVTALARLKQALSSSSSPATSTTPAVTDPRTAKEINHEKQYGSVTAPGEIPKESFMSSLQRGMSLTFSKEAFSGMWALIQAEAAKPQNKTAFSLYTSLIGGGQLAKFGAGAVNSVKGIWESLKGVGNAIPAFANGAVVYGPTLSMVGDNPGARTNPEVIAPLSDLEAIMGTDNAEVVAVLRSILQAVRENRTVQAVIASDDVGRAAVDFINDESRRGRNPLYGL